MVRPAGPGVFAGLWRLILVVWGVALLALTAGFALQEPLVTGLWPWPDGRLSYLFIGSILAAVGLPIIWIGVSGELGAQRAGALDFALSFSGITATLWLFYQSGREELLIPMLIAADAVLFNLVIYFFSRVIPFRDKRRTPGLVRWSFLFFALILVAVGIWLLMKQPFVFPWPLKPETSMVFGWVFLGAAVYFLHGVFYPHWVNAKGQLLGFLAYDIVLLWPYTQHLQSVKQEHFLSLVIYIGVLVYSFLLAVYFLFLHRHTRFGS